MPFGGYGDAAEFDPVSKKIIGFAGQRLFLFDPATRKTTITHEDVADKFQVSAYSGTLVYFPPDECVYGIPETKKIWKLALERSDFSKSKIVKIDAKGDVPGHSECAFVYDPVNKLISGGVLGNKFYAFDPATATWAAAEIKGEQPGDMTFHCLAYDPVDDVFVFIAKEGTWAYRAKRR